ncbi:hypothetical protein [Nannocystis punicea]|uniref:D-alanyl-D-alanine carboxypeptidase-like protein n=1 Tax=Nannocystis punicea TaxID=2995304 RepID=A0ABY7GST0_9BACT|nr:hypothetical protein [Nannocystis poenicansa]WAS90014.1 hypothetical protein O0S08_27790 [Nannocystis poenicansa]
MSTAKVIGLNIRKEASGRSAKLGLLPRGARIELGERSKDGKWARIGKVVSGQIAPVQQNGAVDPAAATGWVFIGELDQGAAQPEAFDEVVAPAKPVAMSAGEFVGYIGEYQQHVDALQAPVRGRRPLLHLEVFTGEDVPAFIEKCRQYAKTLPAGSGTLFVVEKGAKLVQPAQPNGEIGANDGVVPVESKATGAWAQVKRGTTQVMDRGKLGDYNSASKTYKSGAVFTGWFVGAQDGQRTQDEAESKRLGYQRREVMIPSGQPLWVERAALDARAKACVPLKTWSEYPLRVANAGDPPVTLTRVMSKTELERTPANGRATDPDGNRWWRVSARRDPDSSGNTTAVGWACEKGHDKVSWQSPWAWPGFEFVEEGEIEPVDQWSTMLYRMGMANDEELTDFKMRADKVDKSALLQKLYELIDTNKNWIFEPHELRAAMRQPLLAQALSRIISRYESEWGGEDAKWDALDPLVLDGKPEWQAEKLRIKGLRWWPQVAAKVKDFPSSPLAFHIHPIGLIENFYSQPSSTAASTDTGGAREKSGVQWVSRFMPSAAISDLKDPFRTSVTNFFNALATAGVARNINTTLRPPQRSYLMYYAREVSTGRIAPDKVPAFVPQDGDAPVNIDWAHLDSAGKPNLTAAKQAAKEMDAKYGAAGAIGMAYRSNHNKGQAIDVSFTPGWGIGKSVVDANGKTVAIKSKQDLLNVGASYGVYHWTYHGAKSKSDEPHWSLTGN